jgi:hypothetical protein
MFSPRLLLHLVLAFFAAHALLRPQWVLELSQGSRATLAAFGLVAVAVALLGWLVAMRLPRRLPRLPGLRYLAGGLVLVAATAMLLTAYPWLRARPVRDALSLVEVLARPAAPVVAIERGSVVLTAADPRFEVALEGRAVREVLVDAHLVHAANLPGATPGFSLWLWRVGARTPSTRASTSPSGPRGDRTWRLCLGSRLPRPFAPSSRRTAASSVRSTGRGSS